MISDDYSFLPENCDEAYGGWMSTQLDGGYIEDYYPDLFRHEDFPSHRKRHRPDYLDYMDDPVKIRAREFKFKVDTADKPWLNSSNPSSWFNFNFHESSFKEFIRRQIEIRLEPTLRKKITEISILEEENVPDITLIISAIKVLLQHQQ